MSFCLGIDVGSTTVKVVAVDGVGDLLEHVYLRAQGQPARVLLEALDRLARRWDLERASGVGITGSGSDLLAPLLGGLRVNELIAQTHALNAIAPYARTVIEMGGQDSKLLILGQEPDGGCLHLADFAMNMLCAAGTGSFLDQQAERLGVSIEEFASLALQARNPARIAGRCAVFARSDMVHLQQRGVPLPDIVAGLCLAVARNFRGVVGSGKPFCRPILFQGGVACNVGMVWAFEEVLSLEPGALVVPPHCTLMAAWGAARIARAQAEASPPFRGLDPLADFVRNSRGGPPAALPRLRLQGGSSTRGEFREQPGGDTGSLSVYVGIDVGSISTKAVLLDAQGELVAGRYLPTAGRPLEAVRLALRQVVEGIEGRVRVVGAGVTGSGRRLVGHYVGADLVCNEITAQARAALAFDAAVDTVFEIGGQDSKYICLRDGMVVDFAMNKACAAGTGSFLEEHARRLHLPVGEFGRLALAASSPADLGERCTVFMESDVVHHQQLGAQQEDLMAGLAYAAARNYLNRVVQRRPIGQRVLFQGGVASNPAVVAAFAELLRQPVEVSPHHRLSGAIGVALLAMEEREQGPGDGRPVTCFHGFDLSRRSYRSATFECQDCANHCEVHRVVVTGEQPFFHGARCERSARGGRPGRRGRRGADVPLPPDLFAEREALLSRGLQDRRTTSGGPRVGIPRVLHFYDLLPFWCRFFQELGWEVILSPPTTPAIVTRSAAEAGAETCFPVKLAYGHVLALLDEGVDRVFFPSLVNRPGPLPGHVRNCHCPFIQAAPHLVEAALRTAGRPAPLLHPPLHFLWKDVLARDLRAFACGLGVSPRRVGAARRAAGEAQRRFETAWRRRGEQVLAGLAPGQVGAVLVGRSYNTADPGINAGVPLKLRRMGIMPLPMDLLPLSGVEIGDLVTNMFWYSGQRILAAARLIRQDPRLQAVYVTNFGCGPDSFLFSFFREALGGKPFLELEMDDHSADAGLVTRLEAFFDRLRGGWGGKQAGGGGDEGARGEGDREIRKQGDKEIGRQGDKETRGGGDRGAGGGGRGRGRGRGGGGVEGGGRRVYVPYVCDPAHMLAAAMRFYGLEAEVLPPPDEETLAIGRELCLGRECLPCYTIVGDIVRRARQPGFDPAASAYLIPTSAGPCRLGQFHDLLRLILRRLGLQALEVCAPSAENGYQYRGLDVPPLLVGRLAWQGLVGVNLLEKFLHQHRPYERVPGAADRVYRASFQELLQAIEGGGGRRAMAVMAEAARRFARLEVERRDGRPVIGVVGEFYLRLNPFTNQDVIRHVEALGGEVRLAPMMEWLYYANFFARFSAAATHRYVDLLRILLAFQIQRWDERRILEPVAECLRNAHEPAIADLMRSIHPYYHPVLRTEAPMSIGKAIDFARQGADGILNVMPFTCMPGTVVSGLARRVRADYGRIPWLDVIYDGQGDTGLRTRLEAFLHQARQFRERREPETG